MCLTFFPARPVTAPSAFRATPSTLSLTVVLRLGATVVLVTLPVLVALGLVTEALVAGFLVVLVVVVGVKTRGRELPVVERVEGMLLNRRCYRCREVRMAAANTRLRLRYLVDRLET